MKKVLKYLEKKRIKCYYKKYGFYKLRDYEI